MEAFGLPARTRPVVRASCGRRSARHAFARAGLDERARALLETITPVLVASSPWVEAQPGAVAFAAEAAWVLRAPEFRPAAARPARAVAEARAGDFYMANSELALARLLTVLGRDAQRRSRAPERRCEERDLPVLRAIADHDDGLARRRAGEPGPSRGSRRPPSGSRRSG